MVASARAGCAALSQVVLVLDHETHTRGRGLDYRHRALRTCAQLTTAGDLVRAWDARPADGEAVDWPAWVRTHLAPTDGRQRRRGTTLRALESLLQDIPQEWTESARAHGAQPTPSTRAHHHHAEHGVAAVRHGVSRSAPHKAHGPHGHGHAAGRHCPAAGGPARGL